MIRTMLLSAGLLLSSFAQAETWYYYCVAEKSDVRICSGVEQKTPESSQKCSEFARSVGSYSSMLRYSSSSESLESTMGDYCDEVRGSDGSIYDCQVAVACSEAANTHVGLTKRAFAHTPEQAIDRCFNLNETRVKLELRRQSTKGCYVKLEAVKSEIPAN